MIELKPVTKAEWIAALRSGEYAQTREVLQDETGYCCLGVLCHLAGVPDEAQNTLRFADVEKLYDSMNFQYMENQFVVVHMNDKLKSSFNEIADYLEGEANA